MTNNMDGKENILNLLINIKNSLKILQYDYIGILYCWLNSSVAIASDQIVFSMATRCRNYTIESQRAPVYPFCKCEFSIHKQNKQFKGTDDFGPSFDSLNPPRSYLPSSFLTCCAILPTSFGGKAMTGRTAPSSDGLLSRNANARRSVHNPWGHFIFILIISDRRN